jgi:hypothetical protein
MAEKLKGTAMSLKAQIKRKYPNGFRQEKKKK